MTPEQVQLRGRRYAVQRVKIHLRTMFAKCYETWVGFHGNERLYVA
jgi:hypothetical protein